MGFGFWGITPRIVGFSHTHGKGAALFDQDLKV